MRRRPTAPWPRRKRPATWSARRKRGRATSPHRSTSNSAAAIYFLSRPLVLAPEDSGTQQAPIVWSAYQDEHPTLSGGERITGWTKTTVNGREAWMAKIPENGGPRPSVNCGSTASG